MAASNISLAGLSDYYQREWHAKADPRSADWPFVQSPLWVITLAVSYLAFVFIGPAIMKNRKPFDLRLVMAVYNLLLVCLSLYMFIEFQLSTIRLPNRYCTASNFSDDPQGVRLANVVWVAYMSKMIELFDTVIFILRKKNSQVTFLHVYHHAIVVIVAYMAVRWYPGGITWFFQYFNSAIHFLMYFYYFVSGLGPQFQPYLWWKKYLTFFQIVQFAAGVSVIIYSFAAGCDHPAEWNIIMGFYLGSLFILFSMFFRGKYKPRPEKKE